MKRILFLLCLLLGTCLAKADVFKVLFVNDKSLKFTNGKPVRVGDKFKEATDIRWEKDKQAIKAINLGTKKQTLFVGKSWIKKTGIEALLHKRHLSTHDDNKEPGQLTLFDKLQRTFDDQYDLLDAIEVKTEVELSDACYFQVSYMYGDTKKSKRLAHKENSVIIDSSIFDVDGEQLPPRDVELTIDYVNNTTGETFFVKDHIELTIIPSILK